MEIILVENFIHIFCVILMTKSRRDFVQANDNEEKVVQVDEHFVCTIVKGRLCVVFPIVGISISPKSRIIVRRMKESIDN